jgi:hypothetical protein
MDGQSSEALQKKFIEEWWNASIAHEQFSKSKYRLSLNTGDDTEPTVLFNGYFAIFRSYAQNDCLADIWYRNEVRDALAQTGNLRVRARWDLPPDSGGVLVSEAALTHPFVTDRSLTALVCLDDPRRVNLIEANAEEARLAAQENREPRKREIEQAHMFSMVATSYPARRADGNNDLNFHVHNIRTGEDSGRPYNLPNDRVYSIYREDVFRSELEFLQVYGGPRPQRQQSIEGDFEMLGGALFTCGG